MCVYRSRGTVLSLVETSNLKANRCQKNGAKLIKMHTNYFQKNRINFRFVSSIGNQNPNSNLSLTVCFDLQFEKKRGQTASSLLKTNSKHQLYQFTFGVWTPTDETKWAKECPLFFKNPNCPHMFRGFWSVAVLVANKRLHGQ